MQGICSGAQLCPSSNAQLRVAPIDEESSEQTDDEAAEGKRPCAFQVREVSRGWRGDAGRVFGGKRRKRGSAFAPQLHSTPEPAIWPVTESWAASGRPPARDRSAHISPGWCFVFMSLRSGIPQTSRGNF